MRAKIFIISLTLTNVFKVIRILTFFLYALYSRHVNWRLVEDGETGLAQQTERNSDKNDGRCRQSNIALNASLHDTRNMQESEKNTFFGKSHSTKVFPNSILYNFATHCVFKILEFTEIFAENLFLAAIFQDGGQRSSRTAWEPD